MDQISVTNFRKFSYFTPRNLGDINIFVGGNNSGKSTLVKAILLALDNIRTMRMGGAENFKQPQFRFDANQYHDVKIGTYSRALCHKIDELNSHYEGLSDYNIHFEFTIGDFEFMVCVTGDPQSNSATASIYRIQVINMKYGIGFYYLGEDNKICIQLLFDPKGKRDELMDLADCHADIVRNLNKATEEGIIADITRYSADLDKIIAQIKPLLVELHIPEDEDEDETDLSWLDDYCLEDTELVPFPSVVPSTSKDTTGTRLQHKLMVDQIVAAVEKNTNQHNHAIATVGFDINTDELHKDDLLLYSMISQFIETLYPMKLTRNQEDVEVEEYQMVQQELDNISRFRDELRSLLNSINVEYISAHSANQNVVYSITDKNDHIAQAIHEFYREQITKGSQEDIFVKKWMKELGVGIDYTITPIHGEAYTVDIVENYLSDYDDETICQAHVNLADKGMGSIQVMVMLFRIAAILHRFSLANGVKPQYKPLIIIEEPEQNLHPNLQSKLAELFKEVNEKYHCRFIIESHSEYLVRNIQVLVAKEKYADEEELKENNPFKVLYFKQDDDPEEMIFRTDGKFSNDFGEGFYDEAKRLLFEIL